LKFFNCNLYNNFCVRCFERKNIFIFVTTKPNDMNRFLMISVFSLIILSSCHYFHGEHVDGNGTIKKESRAVGIFNGIEAGGAIDVYIRQDSSRTVNIETDENLLPYVEIRNDGDVLSIFPKDGYNLDPSK
jgi:hypothetical protein